MRHENQNKMNMVTGSFELDSLGTRDPGNHMLFAKLVRRAGKSKHCNLLIQSERTAQRGEG